MEQVWSVGCREWYSHSVMQTPQRNLGQLVSIPNHYGRSAASTTSAAALVPTAAQQTPDALLKNAFELIERHQRSDRSLDVAATLNGVSIWPIWSTFCHFRCLILSAPPAPSGSGSSHLGLQMASSEYRSPPHSRWAPFTRRRTINIPASLMEHYAGKCQSRSGVIHFFDLCICSLKVMTCK